MNFRALFQSAALAASLILVFTGNGRAAISLGIDELEKANFSALQGKRVGLVTNPSGVDSRGRSAIDALYSGQSVGGYKLIKLFGPEHGIDGQTKAGDPVSNSRDPPYAPARLFALHHAPRAITGIRRAQCFPASMWWFTSGLRRAGPRQPLVHFY